MTTHRRGGLACVSGVFFCVSSSFCGSQSKRYSRANGPNRKRWERGRGENINGSPPPHRFLFRPCADVGLLAKHTKKTASYAGERWARAAKIGGWRGLRRGRGREVGGKCKTLNYYIPPFIYFVKSVRILNQKQEPSNITEVKFCALIRQNFTP